ncbi:MAG: phosphoribosylanthranilate isomerase [Gemmatimonadetes bacterium]|nr:phosphoribosylanthranilate isomerase [Gemmatimonadota bacterium]
MSGVLVKICGLGSPADAAAARAAGADYVGVVLVPGRLRTRTVSEAAAIFAAAGAALRVGVFADTPVDDVLAASSALRLAAVQLHGSEAVSALVRLRAGGAPELWKAVPAQADLGATVAALDRYAAVADAIVLDGADGGRGVRFDWTAFRGVRDRLPRAVRLVVAGGLAPDNVAAAVAALGPDVVDVSSGVESAPGAKSGALMRTFVAAVRGGGME